MLISRVARAGGGVESGPGAISDEDEIPLATLQRRKAALRLKNSIPVNDIGRNGKGIAALNIGKTDEQTEKPLGALSMRKEAPKSPPVRSYGRSSTAVKEEISHSPPVPSYRRPRTVVSLPKKEARFPTQTLLKRHVVDAFPVIVCNGFRIWDQRGLDLYTAINDYVAVALLDVGRIMEERLGIEVDADAIYDPVTLHLKVFSDTERPVHVRWFPEWHFDYVDHKSGIVRKDTKTVPFVSVKRGFHGTPAVAFDMRNRDHIHRLVPPGTRLNVGVMASLIICTTSTSWNARSDPEIGEFLPKLVDELRREHANDCCVLFERSSEITININPEDTPLPAWIPAAGKYKGSGNASVRWPLPKRPDFLPPPVESLKKPWRKHDSSPLPMPATNVPKQQNLASSDNVGFRMEDMPSASSSQAKQTDKAAAEKTLERRPTRHVTRVSTKEPRADKADRAQSDGPKLLCSDDMDARIKIGSAAQAAGGISLKRRPSTGTETGLKKARSDLPDDRLRSSEEVDARIKNRLSAEEDSLKRRPSTEIAPGAKKARSVVNVVGVVGDAAVNKRAMRRATMPSIVARWIVGPSLEATPGHAKGWEAESRSAALDEGHFENASDAGRSRETKSVAMFAHTNEEESKRAAKVLLEGTAQRKDDRNIEKRGCSGEGVTMSVVDDPFVKKRSVSTSPREREATGPEHRDDGTKATDQRRGCRVEVVEQGFNNAVEYDLEHGDDRTKATDERRGDCVEVFKRGPDKAVGRNPERGDDRTKARDDGTKASDQRRGCVEVIERVSDKAVESSSMSGSHKEAKERGRNLRSPSPAHHLPRSHLSPVRRRCRSRNPSRTRESDRHQETRRERSPELAASHASRRGEVDRYRPPTRRGSSADHLPSRDNHGDRRLSRDEYRPRRSVQSPGPRPSMTKERPGNGSSFDVERVPARNSSERGSGPAGPATIGSAKQRENAELKVAQVVDDAEKLSGGITVNVEGRRSNGAGEAEGDEGTLFKDALDEDAPEKAALMDDEEEQEEYPPTQLGMDFIEFLARYRF